MRRTASGARAFTAFNAGKRMREIDIASEAGRAEVLALAREADVMVDNYRPGVLRRYGLGYDDVKAVNPRIIYCAISGYGCSDPVRTSQGAYDHVIQAFTGMTHAGRHRGRSPAQDRFSGHRCGDRDHRRARDRGRAARARSHGRGLLLDVSMWASALQLMYSFACETLTCDQEIPRVGNKGYSGSPGADTFACRDGWLAIGANTPAHVARLMQVLEVASADGRTPAGTRGRGGVRASPVARDPQRSASCSRRAC
jgi:crotonobetainyl-CoA:carnitine CoA-transferase CaiB-like acyl-CoA transferase